MLRFAIVLRGEKNISEGKAGKVMCLVRRRRKTQGMAGIRSGNYSTDTVSYLTCLRAAAEEMQYRDSVTFLIRG